MKLRRVFTHWLSTVILRLITPECLTLFRKLERCSIKLVKVSAHLRFNETCLNNRLLPTYTNIQLHDDATMAEPFVEDFRHKLVKSQIEKQLKEAEDYNQMSTELKFTLASSTTKIKYDALIMFLARITDSKVTQLNISHQNKLVKLHGSPAFLKQQPKTVLNLSSTPLNSDMQAIFDLGMSCHLRSKYDMVRKKIEVEKLYSQIDCERKQNNLTVHSEERLKCELKRFGLRQYRCYERDVLTKEQHEAIKNFNKNDSIIVRRADKCNTFVIMDKVYYEEQMDLVVGDRQKFVKVDRDPTDKLKKKLNGLIETSNAVQHPHNLKKLIGHFSPGYLYGNPKIHKRLIEPPMRPIISQIGTPTYDIAKQLNATLKKYIPSGYMVNSTDEFLNILRASGDRRGLLGSLDVDSLFTQVPVTDTVDIILQHAYHHETFKPPHIPKQIMKQLLITCTTQTPFRHVDGSIYLQKDGVSMGSPLGPLFANFYMANLENSVIPTIDSHERPLIYCRYVDDIFYW